MKRIRAYILMAVGAAAVILLLCLMFLAKDRTGPVITIPANIDYRDGMSSKELLNAVTAMDERDGDVSDSLIVKSIINLSKGNGVKIIYAAQDHHNNVSEKSVIIYTATNSADNSTVALETEENTSEAEPAKTEAEPEETAEEITEEETEAPDIDPAAPVLILTTDSVEIKKGSDVNWLKFVSDITDDKDDRNTLFRVIMINDYADVNTPGEYYMKYRCRDSDGNESPVAVLKVTVTD